LVKAVRRWRPERGAFLAYAMPTIEGEVKRHFRDGASTIRIPRQLYETQPQVTAAQRALRQELSREPTSAEIASRTGMPARQVREILDAATTCQPLSADDGSDVFEAFSSQDADRDLAMVALRSRLRPALAALPDRERHIIALRFVWGQSQMQIAHGLGVSQMQVSRVLRAALSKIRDQIVGPEADGASRDRPPSRPETRPPSGRMAETR
jgi:RNA polymerase sigma-B factor